MIVQAVRLVLWDLVLGFARLPRQLEIALAGMFVPGGFGSASGYEHFQQCLDVAIVERFAETTTAGLVILVLYPRRKSRWSRQVVVGWVETG